MKLRNTEFADVIARFISVRTGLLEDWEKFAGIQGSKQQREGASTVLKADLWAEQRLVPVLRYLWPGVPFLCEEAGNSGLATLVPGIELLSWDDDVTNLPDNFVSVDGVDGSALYANQCFELVAMMAGLVKDGRPSAGIVTMLDDGAMYHTGVNGQPGVFKGDKPHEEWLVPVRPLNKCLICVDDCGSVDEDFRKLVTNMLTGTKDFAYPMNTPSGAGPINVLRGRAAAYVSSNARNWDQVATAALLGAAGMIVRCLDGSEVPWKQTRMPAVVFARDEETFCYIQKQAKEYLELQKKKQSAA
ncbi:MAG TPA: inositol monophosphatase family protein [Candidatus Andersenbacteria bacterium]|nr:inositol monophosphatase family protein [Candidatus Andersenbacteria bacterium]